MATHKARWVFSLAGAALVLLGLEGSVDSLDQLTSRWSDFFCLSLRAAMETLPSISLGAWQISGLDLLGHLRVLESLLQISASCWQMGLILAGAA